MDNKLIFNTSVDKDAVTDCSHLNKLALAWEKVSGLQIARHVGPFMQLSREGIDGHEEMKWGFKAHCQSFDLFNDMNERLQQREFEVTSELDNPRS